jgi:hypothetical protein
MTKPSKEQIELFRAHEDSMIAEHGWMAHYVPDIPGKCINYHTHGMRENYNHMDFQVVFPLDPKLIHTLIAQLHEIVKNGGVIPVETRYDKVLGGGFDVYFQVFQEAGRNVLRMILPDKNNMLPCDKGCDPEYLFQMTDLE